MLRPNILHPFRLADPRIDRVLAFIARQTPRAWLVGGVVRDVLLGRTVHDLDVIVPSGAMALARSLSRSLDGASFVLDADRDVARVILNGAGQPLTVDLARLRVPELAGDLALRDFTMNAMAVEIAGLVGEHDGAAAEPIDPFGGRDDLARGIIRVVSDDAFRDDPLRTLRGVRQAVELGFQLEGETAGLIRRDAHLLPRVAAERVREELVRIIDTGGAWQHVRWLAALDLLRYTLPEAQALVGVTQSEPHYLDVFDHTRSVMAHAEGLLALLWPGSRYSAPDRLSGQAGGTLVAGEAGGAGARDPVVIAPEWQWEALSGALAPFADDLRAHLLQPLASGRTRRDWSLWAALAHDWGKAATRSVGSDGRVHFYEHEHRGAALAGERTRLLTFSAAESGYLAQLVDLHMRPGHLATSYPPSRRALYRLFRDAGTTGPDVALLALADKVATRAPQAEQDLEFWKHLLDVAVQVFTAYFREQAARVSPVPLLDGRAVMAELALPPGPRIGRLLEGLREAQAVGEVATVEEARAWLRSQRSG